MKRLLLIAVWLLPVPWCLAADQARIAAVSGSAVVKPVDDPLWRSARTGDSVTTGQRIRTKARSRVKIELADGSKIEVYPNSSVNLTSLQPANPSLKVSLGRLKAWVSKNVKRSKFEVHTPVAVCSVRGTEFTVEVDEQGKSGVEVFEGLVGVRRADGMGEEIPVGAGEKLDILMDRAVTADQKAEAYSDERNVRNEVGLEMSKEAVQAAAAQEMRLAEYQEGKTMIDVFGSRVRMEEYIMRPAADTFKLVVLNERENRFDYFYYKGTFNKDLPVDLSVALRQMGGTIGSTAPDYYLTSYEQAFSNTQDSSKDVASGGHLVQITLNSNGTYTIADPTDPSRTQTVNAADVTNGAYDPVSDTFDPTRTTSLDITLFNPANDTYQRFDAGQTLWKTRFNSYEHLLNDVRKQLYIKSSGITGNTLVADLDGHWVYPSKDSQGNTIYGEWGVLSADASYPDGAELHNRIRTTYCDNTFEQYDTYILADDGTVAKLSDFDGVTGGTAYKEKLLQWNYEQVLTASEFNGRKIDLVVEPKILIKSGIIQ